MKDTLWLNFWTGKEWIQNDLKDIFMKLSIWKAIVCQYHICSNYKIFELNFFAEKFCMWNRQSNLRFQEFKKHLLQNTHGGNLTSEHVLTFKKGKQVARWMNEWLRTLFKITCLANKKVNWRCIIAIELETQKINLTHFLAPAKYCS